jgi:diguanylate cyclase (GGDEF)-like protein
MISFDDVTEMERKKVELAALVKTLRSSRDEVEIQNQKLSFLASYDPLTECMNRRAFWIEFDQMWADAEPFELSLMMIDVDHFKSFNDTYGHSFGDLVLQSLGKTLRDTVSDRGIVSRFGGEEFVVAVAQMTLDEALELTHAIHEAIGEIDVEGKRVTASIGFSNREFKAMDGQHMLDQADISLYAAKRGGRNCVMRFDECEPNDGLASDEAQTSDSQKTQDSEIPQAAVEGFLKAVEYRCQATADHSRRVARLCASIGKTFLRPEESYRLEVAAQLHEIGKLGIPDSILNKSEQLSTNDWQIVSQQRRIGLQLTQSVFSESVVPQIIEANQNTEVQQEIPQGNSDTDSSTGDDPLETSVAILAVCDHFDSLIHGSDNRAGLQIEDAIKRIKQCVPTRFRADIVGKFVEHIEKFGAERQLTRGGGMGEYWPPQLKPSIEAIPAKEIETASAAPLASSVDSKLFDAEELVGTSLDDEINTTMKLANELLGLCDEGRSVAKVGEDQVVDPETSRESS